MNCMNHAFLTPQKQRKQRLVTVKVNGKSASSTVLKEGDKLQVGNTGFRYAFPEDA